MEWGCPKMGVPYPMFIRDYVFIYGDFPKSWGCIFIYICLFIYMGNYRLIYRYLYVYIFDMFIYNYSYIYIYNILGDFLSHGGTQQWIKFISWKIHLYIYIYKWMTWASNVGKTM